MATDYIGHIHDMLLAALGQRETVWFPVLKGNGVTLMVFDRKVYNAAKIGTKVSVDSGGYVEKFADESWHQWRYVPPTYEPLLQRAARKLLAGPRARRGTAFPQIRS